MPTSGSNSPTKDATNTPVPNSFKLAPKVNDNNTMPTSGSNSPMPLKPVSTNLWWLNWRDASIKK